MKRRNFISGLAAIIAGTLLEPASILAQSGQEKTQLPYNQKQEEKIEYQEQHYTRVQLLKLFKQELGDRYKSMQKDKEKMKYWNALWEKAEPNLLKNMIEQYDPRLSPMKDNENPDISSIPKEKLELYSFYLPWTSLSNPRDRKVIINYDKSMSPFFNGRTIVSVLRYLKSKKD